MHTQNLRSRILRGGAYLSVRQALGMVIGIVGMVLLTRIIGPAQYGLYAAAMGIFAAAQLIAQLGVNVFLIRHESPIDATTRNTAASVLLLLGIAGAALLLVAAPILERTTRIAGFAPVAMAVFLTLPITQLAQVPLALLDRNLDYKRMAWVELIAQVIFVGTSLAFAFAEYGAWSLVIGFWAQQVSFFVMLHAVHRYWPQFGWNQPVARAAVKYGVAYTASSWIYQLRRVVNPLVVGRYLGPEAVAVVSVTAQIVTNLSFIMVATWRLSTAALARVQNDTARMARAINEGMTLQVLATAPFLIVFAFVGPYLVPRLMGTSWTPVMKIYPYLALVTLITSAFALQSSALYVLKQNAAMARYHIVHVGLLALAAWLLVPRFGLHGYGAAEVATILSFVVLHRETSARLPGLRYFVMPRDLIKQLQNRTASTALT